MSNLTIRPNKPPRTTLPTMARRLQQQQQQQQKQPFLNAERTLTTNKDFQPAQEGRAPTVELTLSHVPNQAKPIIAFRNVAPQPFVANGSSSKVKLNQKHLSTGRSLDATGISNHTSTRQGVSHFASKVNYPGKGDGDKNADDDEPVQSTIDVAEGVLSSSLNPTTAAANRVGSPSSVLRQSDPRASQQQNSRTYSPTSSRVNPASAMLKHKGNNNHITNNSSSNNNNFNNAEKVFDPASRLGEYFGGSVAEKKWVAGPGAGMRRAIATGASQRPTGDSSSNLANEELQKVHPSEEERIKQKRVSVKRALNNLDELLDQLRPTMDHPKEALDESRDDQPHCETVEQSLSQVSALMEHLVNQAELNHDDTDPSQCLDQSQCPDQSRKTSTASVASSNSSASSLSSLIEDKSRNQSREASVGPDNFSEATTSRKTSHAESVREVEDQVDSLTKQLTECLETKEVVNWSRDIKSTTIFGNCPKCDQPIEKEASVVGESHYHPGCFICEGCQEPLGTQSFFIIDGKNYCSKDRERFLEKCVKCMKKIEGDTIRPRESGEAYHPSCFSCQQCSKELFGKYYDINGQLICEDDYIASREKCCKCREAIIGTVLKALDGAFHPECFTCAACPLCLDGVQFFLTEDKDPLCETCYTRLAAKRCDGCKEPIVEDCLVSKDPGGYYHKNCYTERVGPSRS